MIKKLTIFITTAAMLPVMAFADGEASSKLTAKIGGSLDSQYGVVSQSKAFRYQGANKLKNNSLVNSGKVKIEIDAKAESGLKYGGMMEFNTNTSQSKTGSSNILNKAMIYAEDVFGRLEAGSYDGATGKFRENTFDKIDVATGGAWGGDSVFWINGKTASGKDLDAIFLLSPDLVVAHDASGSANKITYFTPKWNGMQLGLTYVPDSAVKGTVNNAMSQSGNTFNETIENGAVKDPKFKPGYRNVLDLGLKYDVKFNDVAVSSFISGEIGQSKKYHDTSLHARKPLRAWEIGSSVNYKDLTLGASYGDWGTSGVYKDTTKGNKRRSSFYTLGVGYSICDLSAAVTYFNSKAATGLHGGIKQGKYDKASMLSFALQYKLMPGFVPYAEVTHFKLAEHNQVVNKGNILLVGTKLSF